MAGNTGPCVLLPSACPVAGTAMWAPRRSRVEEYHFCSQEFRRLIFRTENYFMTLATLSSSKSTSPALQAAAGLRFFACGPGPWLLLRFSPGPLFFPSLQDQLSSSAYLQMIPRVTALALEHPSDIRVIWVLFGYHSDTKQYLPVTL